MIEFEYPPQDRPTLEQQQDALRKGLGRCHQWSVSGILNHEALLHACLNDLRYDRQCNEPRSDWLWSLMLAAGTVESFRETILAAWLAPLDNATAVQLCGLAYHFAHAGDERFRVRLREIVRENILGDADTFGEEELMRLEGRGGLLFVTEHRGLRLCEREWGSDDLWTTKDAVNLFGAESVTAWLEASTDTAVVRFREAWAKRRSETSPVTDFGAAWEEQWKRLDVSDILAEAEKAAPQSGLFRGWGAQADERSLAAIAEKLPSIERTESLRLLLQVFAMRQCAEVIPPAIALFEHEDYQVRQRAFRALERNTSHEVREFALRELQPHGAWLEAVGLLVRNYQDGDESRIEEVLEVPEDLEDSHSLFMDVLKLLRENATADARRLALAAYFHTPCTFCRQAAAELLQERGLAPEWLSSECLHDCDSTCRATFSGADTSVTD